MTAAPWVAHYEPGVTPVLVHDDSPFQAALHAAAAAAPAYPALTCGNRTVGFAELEALTGRVAASLRRDGCGQGSAVLVALPNGLPMAATALGALRIGAVVVPVDPADGADRLLAVAAAVAPAVAVVPASAPAAVATALATGGARVVAARSVEVLPRLVRWIHRVGAPRRARQESSLPDPAVAWSEWLAARSGDGDVEPDPDRPALRIVGGGPRESAAGAGDIALAQVAAGEPGARTFSHAHLAAAARQGRAWLVDAVPGEDTWLVLAPLSTPLGFVLALGTAFLLRARVILLPRPTSRNVRDTLRYLRPAYVIADAASLEALVGDPALAHWRAWSVRAWLVGDRLPADVAHRFEEATGVELCQGLAVPAAAGLVTCNPLNAHRAAGSIGLPLPDVQARVVGFDGAERPAGVTGRLEVRGPNVPGPNWVGAGVDGWLDEAGFVYLAPPG